MKRTQADLADSLTIALELAWSFLDRAQIEKGIATERARETIATARELEYVILDPKARDRINRAADELQTLLDKTTT